MGWTITTNPRRSDLIAQRIAPYDGGVQQINENHPFIKFGIAVGTSIRSKWITIAKCYRGGRRAGILWQVREINTYNYDTKELLRSERFIQCDYLKYYPDTRHELGGWGYKDMEESMGPNFYSCPIKYLDMTPLPDSEYALEWREKVRQFREEKKKNRLARQ